MHKIPLVNYCSIPVLICQCFPNYLWPAISGRFTRSTQLLVIVAWCYTTFLNKWTIINTKIFIQIGAVEAYLPKEKTETWVSFEFIHKYSVSPTAQLLLVIAFSSNDDDDENKNLHFKKCVTLFMYSNLAN